MSKLQAYNHVFEGTEIATIIYRGRPCWVATQVGTAIGYEQEGRRFRDRMLNEWAEEFIDGRDWEILKGDKLREFKELAEQSTVRVHGFTSRLILLYESGLHLSLIKTRKPKGRALRRELADKVLPQLARDGRYDPERMVTPEGKLVDPAADEREDRRLSMQESELDLRRRQMEAGALLRLAGTMRSRGRIGEDILESLEVTAAEIESGRDLAALKPPADESLGWESPTSIANRMGVTRQRVGRTITALGLRDDPRFSRAIVNNDRTVQSYLYSPDAVQRIEAALAAR